MLGTLLALVLVLVIVAIAVAAYRYLSACHQGKGGALCHMWHWVA